MEHECSLSFVRTAAFGRSPQMTVRLPGIYTVSSIEKHLFVHIE